ncbi:MAG: hypothetical protein AB1405_04855, partial [Bdellovibrionota bacterium]
AARPAPPPPMPAMAAAPSMGAPSVDAAALERTIREVVEREVAKALAEVTRAVSQEVRGQVAKIAEKLILEEIEKLKSEG